MNAGPVIMSIGNSTTLPYDVSKDNDKEPIRSISVRGCSLEGASIRQMSCLEEFEDMQKHEAAEEAIDDIRRRYGHFSVQRGIMLTNKELSNLDPKSEHVIHPVGFLR